MRMSLEEVFLKVTTKESAESVDAASAGNGAADAATVEAPRG
jgi:hypothetical protein